MYHHDHTQQQQQKKKKINQVVGKDNKVEFFIFQPFVINKSTIKESK